MNATGTHSGFDARELCSRKLWQLVSDGGAAGLGPEELAQIEDELNRRRRRLEDSGEIGTLEPPPR